MYFALIEGIVAARCFTVDRRKVGSDRADWSALAAKAVQLWMVAVTLRFASQYRLSKQCLSP
jgi:hypothetical protein